MKHIRDPLYGYIDVPETELGIINEPDFQRLRRIKQLGLTSTVYPGATHTRFEHSLGVYYLADELAKSLDLSEKQIQTHRIAGLLHDIGHLPYSHTLEHLLNKRADLEHEDLSCEYVDTIANRDSVDFPVEPDAVKNIIRGEASDINIVANDIDVDRLDYLLRDSYNTGIKLGAVEEATLMKFAQVLYRQLGFDYRSLNAVEALLDARLRMNYSVYSHDTVELSSTMLTRAVELYLDNTGNTVTDLVGEDDAQLRHRLSNTSVTGASTLFNDVLNRNLYKTVVFDPLRSVDSNELNYLTDELTPVQKHEKSIAEIAGVDRTHVLINPPESNQPGEFTTPIRESSGEVFTLEEVSSKPQSLRETLRQYTNLHIFAHKDSIDQVEDAARDYLKTLDVTNRVIYSD